MTNKEAARKIRDFGLYHAINDLPNSILTVEAFKMAIAALEKELVHCNECKYYEGVHGVAGHAPCSYWKSGGVMYDWFCSQGEKYIKQDID